MGIKRMLNVKSGGLSIHDVRLESVCMENGEKELFLYRANEPVCIIDIKKYMFKVILVSEKNIYYEIIRK